MITITRTQFILVVVVSRPSTSRSSTIKCFAFFQNGDELAQFLADLHSKILALPSLSKNIVEEKYYSSGNVAKISDCYFLALKYVMDSVGLSGLISQSWNVSRTLIPALTGIFVFAALAYQKPDFTFLTRVFFISNPQLYSIIMAFNAFFSYELVKRSVDFSAASLNVLVGIWAPDFFSKNQAWVLTERTFNNAKLVARVVIIAAIESSDEAQRELRVHKKLLKPLENYFNPSEVENMNLLPGEFSHSDMVILNDKLNEFDEFDEFDALKGSLNVQTMLFLIVCKELRFSFNQTIPDESSAASEVEREIEITNNKLKFCKKIIQVLVYRSPTLRPLARLGRVLVFSSHLAKTSYSNRVVDQQKRNTAYLEHCLQSKLKI
tara:strand:- start:1102 stop:2238 length:1137 start_codon:yes stop_codon:yes gene_type:complete